MNLNKLETLLGKAKSFKTDEKKNITSVTFSKHRKLNVVIEEVEVSDTDVDECFTAFAMNKEGTQMAYGEIACTQDEQANIIKYLADANVKVSAVHNHWLGPDVMYVHWQVKADILTVANNLSALWKWL
jgi:hypothetical protein